MEQSSVREVLYQPHANSTGLVAGWSEAFQDLVRSRELTLRLMMRDITARYRQSFLGWLWALFPGVATTILFVYIKNGQLVRINDPELIPYPVYVFFGFTIWQTFAGGVVATTQSLTGAGHVLSKVNFPRESLVLAALGTTVVELLLRSLLVVGLLIWFDVGVKWTVILVPFILLPLFLLVIGLGFILSALNALVRDISSAVTTLLGLFFFLVPIIYPPPSNFTGTLINDFNPVSAIWIAAHDMTLLGYLSRPSGFTMACLISIVVCLPAWRIFRMAQPIIAERI